MQNRVDDSGATPDDEPRHSHANDLCFIQIDRSKLPTCELRSFTSERLQVNYLQDTRADAVTELEVVSKLGEQKPSTLFSVSGIPAVLGEKLGAMLEGSETLDSQSPEARELFRQVIKHVIAFQGITGGSGSIEVKTTQLAKPWAETNEEAGHCTSFDPKPDTLDQLLNAPDLQNFNAHQTIYDDGIGQHIELNVTFYELEDEGPLAAVTLHGEDWEVIEMLPVHPEHTAGADPFLARNRALSALFDKFHLEGWEATRDYLMTGTSESPATEESNHENNLNQTGSTYDSWLALDDDESFARAMQSYFENPFNLPDPQIIEVYQKEYDSFSIAAYQDLQMDDEGVGSELVVVVYADGNPQGEQQRYRFQHNTLQPASIEEQITEVEKRFFDSISHTNPHIQTAGLKRLHEAAHFQGSKTGIEYSDFMEQLASFVTREMGTDASWQKRPSLNKDQNQIDIFHGRQHGQVSMVGAGKGSLSKLAFAIDAIGNGTIALQSAIGAEVHFQLPDYEPDAPFSTLRFDRLQHLQSCIVSLGGDPLATLATAEDLCGEPIATRSFPYPPTVEQCEVIDQAALVKQLDCDVSGSDFYIDSSIRFKNGYTAATVDVDARSSHKMRLKVDQDGVQEVILQVPRGHWFNTDQTIRFAAEENTPSPELGALQLRELIERFYELPEVRAFDKETQTRQAIEGTEAYQLLTRYFPKVEEADKI